MVDATVALQAAWPSAHSPIGTHEPPTFEKGIAHLYRSGSLYYVRMSEGFDSVSTATRPAGGAVVTVKVSRPFPTENVWGVIGLGDHFWMGSEILAGKTEDTTRIVFPRTCDYITLFVVGARREV